jgi:hypothetical protein
MRDEIIYRVQYIDEDGETAFTDCSSIEKTLRRAVRMRTRFLVQGIVDDVTGDLCMTADQVRNEARLGHRATA